MRRFTACWTSAGTLPGDRSGCPRQKARRMSARSSAACPASARRRSSPGSPSRSRGSGAAIIEPRRDDPSPGGLPHSHISSVALPSPPCFAWSPSPGGGGDEAAPSASPLPLQVGLARFGAGKMSNSATAEFDGEGDRPKGGGEGCDAMCERDRPGGEGSGGDSCAESSESRRHGRMARSSQPARSAAAIMAASPSPAKRATTRRRAAVPSKKSASASATRPASRASASNRGRAAASIRRASSADASRCPASATVRTGGGRKDGGASLGPVGGGSAIGKRVVRSTSGGPERKPADATSSIAR